MFRLFRRFACPTPIEAAVAQLERGEHAAAERAFTELLAVDAASGAVQRAFLLNKRGVARVALGRRQAGRDDFVAALECARHAPALNNLGNLLLEEGNVEAAIVQYEAALAADEAYAVAHFNLGVAYKRAGRVAEGVRSLRRAQKLEGRMPGRPTKQQ